MWINADNQAITRSARALLIESTPGAPPIDLGESLSWLNLDTGATLILARFGQSSVDVPSGFFRLYYKAPSASELVEVSYGLTGRYLNELDYFPSAELNRNLFRGIRRDVEIKLGIREDQSPI